MCSFIDNAEDIRRAYAAFITSGDVLATVLDVLNVTPDFKLVITNYIAKELLAAQFAKLEEAGYAGEDRIPLSRVFVDLPVGDYPLVEPPHSEEPSNTFAEMVVALAGERFDPESIARSREAKGTDAVSVGGRIVLVGGPGQGKSTIGQFVCQLFRASLLRTVPSWSLSDDVRKILRALDVACSKDTLPLPAARRFPVQIVLGEFAAAISRRNAAIKDGRESQPLTLLQFLADKVAIRTGMTVSAAAFRRWLAIYPWVLILDGLDEVPSSSNRDEVLSSINDFWIDANQQNADLMVIATTRPQGYGSEFSAMSFRHLWLLPLSPTRALAYAARLLEARFGDDDDRRSKVLNRLTEATAVDATARLMRSPLQVTIMSTLLDQIGRAPQDRWRLFYEYYQTIYRREMERDTPTAPLLSQFRSDIDTLHYAVAWELQVESERSGGTSARLPVDRFKEILRSKILEKGFDPSDFIALEAQLLEAVENRLVFLVSPQAGVVGFEIRSLQEFMAAQYLMSGETLDVQARLRAIAPASSWRNVFVFAAGRCFSVDEHLRDTVHTICVHLNQDMGGRVGAAIKAGSRLALDLLEDGLADRQPKYARLLAACALELLDLPPIYEQGQLSDIWSPRLEELFREALVTRLTVNPHDWGGWVLMLALLARDIGWLHALAEDCKARLADDLDRLLALPIYGRPPVWLLELFVQRVVANGISSRYDYALMEASRHLADTPAWLKLLLRQVFYAVDDKSTVRVSDGTSEVLGMALVPIVSAQSSPQWSVWLDTPSNDAWAWLRLAAQFVKSPSSRVLREFCTAYSCSGSMDMRMWAVHLMPWPLQAMIQILDEGERTAVLSVLDSEVLGSGDDWIAAEKTWVRDGVQLGKLIEQSSLLPFDPKAKDGIPLLDSVSRYNAGAFHALVGAVRQAPDRVIRARLADWALSVIGGDDPTECRADDVEVILGSLTPDTGIDVAFVSDIRVADAHVEWWVNTLDHIGRFDNLWVGRRTRGLDDLLVTSMKHGPATTGIMRLIALLAADRRHRVGDGALKSLTVFSQSSGRPLTTPIARQSYAVIKCASDIAPEEAVRIADDVLSMEVVLQRQTIQQCIDATRANDTITSGIESFYLRLWEALSDGEAKGYVASALTQIFRRRRAEF